MAKRYIDGDSNDTRETLTDTDGTALTLTNSVRIIYDNTKSKNDIYIACNKIRDKIIQTLS